MDKFLGLGAQPVDKLTSTLAARPNDLSTNVANRLLPFNLHTSPPRSSSSNFTRSASGTTGAHLPPGVVLLRNFVTTDDQARLIPAFDSVHCQAPAYIPSFSIHGKTCFYNVYMTSAGLHWDSKSKSYTKTRVIEGAPETAVPPLPQLLTALHAKAIAAAQAAPGGDLLPCATPGIALLNYYPPGWGKMGAHADKDESRASIARGDPVVSFSVGDSAQFAIYPHTVDYGRIEEGSRAGKKRGRDDVAASSRSGSAASSSTAAGDMAQAGAGQSHASDGASTVAASSSPPPFPKELSFPLHSGDVLVFGGPSRLIKHAVLKILPGHRPPDLPMVPGRLNITVRSV